MRLFGLTVAAICVLNAPALAKDCANPMSQQEITDCAIAAYQETDADLNALYQEINKRLGDDADTKKALVNAQRAWVKFRDAECKFSSSGVIGGSIHRYIYTDCLDRVTKSRVKDFESYLDCQDGDLSCPVP